MDCHNQYSLILKVYLFVCFIFFNSYDRYRGIVWIEVFRIWGIESRIRRVLRYITINNTKLILSIETSRILESEMES